MSHGEQMGPSPKAVAEVLRDIAAALNIARESRFRIAAYERGAEALVSFTGDFGRCVRDERLTEIPGIGARLSALIAEIYTTGTAKLLQSVSHGLPEGALALARGPKLSLRALKTLSGANIRDLDALRAAATEGRLRKLPGFTEKSEARILAALSATESRRGQMILRDALDLSADVERFLRGESVGRSRRRGATTWPLSRGTADPVEHLAIDVVGEVRRGLEVVHGIDLLASAPRSDIVLERFASFPRQLAVEARQESMLSLRLAEGMVVRLHAVAPDARIAALQRLTGSEAHNAAFDRAAAKRGLVVSTTGAFDREGTGRCLLFDNEEQLYARAGLAWVPPLLRDGEEEVMEAERRPLPELVEVTDIRGMVHCHTDFSDGRHTIEQMARAAQDRGMEYITITDHSPTASYAHGVEIDRLKRQWDEIARVQEGFSIRILRGTESDILRDGSLDYPDAILEQLDVIIASIHNRYRLDAAAMTKRIVRAIRHPMFKIWGHALGRLLLHRSPVACDLDAILDAAAESRVAIELNGDPHRLDMEPALARRARARGIRFVVSVDAHAAGELDNIGLGTVMAQRARLVRGDVLNTLDAKAFTRAVHP